jgi:hypothetical protein
MASKKPVPVKKPIAKRAAPKGAVKVPVKAAVRKPVAPAPAPVKTRVEPKAKPVKAKVVPKVKKPKLVRDSFTIPKLEYLVLDELKTRAAALAHPIKKSELLRAGVKALAAMSDNAFLASLHAVPAIKTGRPKLPAAVVAPAKPMTPAKPAAKAGR